MTISLNWIKDYIDISQLSTNEISDLLTDLGLEVEGVTETGGHRLTMQHIVTGEVVECGKHPEADRLSVTKVDVGTDELLNIVCGAPNVAQGQKVVVATIGAEVLDREGNTFKIKKGKIRGAESNGMLCAVDELGLGSDHSGILVLPTETPIGKPIADLFPADTDTIIEIGLTPNRSDATSHVGVARDVAARLQYENRLSSGVKLPDVSTFSVNSKALPINVIVENMEACPRYSGVTIKGVKVQDSPEWLRNRLTAIGVRCINNVVDATNYVLHELGQPLHAFDYSKIKGQTIRVKNLAENTVFKTLDDTDRKLSVNDLMICDNDSTPLCIAGVFGGLHSGVSETTTDIFLESAYFSPKSIRKTATKHLLKTDAAKIFEKGADFNVTIFALKRAALLIQEIAGGEVASEIIDVYSTPLESAKIRVTHRNVQRIIGEKIETSELHRIFQALAMPILNEDAESITVEIPTNKADVIREIDVIEEILRIYGFNRVAMPTQIRTSVVQSVYPDRQKVQNLIADMLAAQGFSEMMAMSLSKSKSYEKTTLADATTMVFVNNTSNVTSDIMRPTMLVSALETITHNQNRQTQDLKLFEFGKTYQQSQNEESKVKYSETYRLSMTLVGQKSGESWLQKPQNATFYTLKAYITAVLSRLGISGYQETALSESNDAFQFGMQFHRGQQNLVTFGKVNPKTVKRFEAKGEVFFADFNWDNVIKALQSATKIKFEELNRFPTVRRDLALVLNKEIKFAEIIQIARKTCKTLLKDVNLFDVFEDESKIGEGKKSYAVSFVFEDKEKTLQDKEIDKLHSELIKAYESKLGALIRK